MVVLTRLGAGLLVLVIAVTTFLVGTTVLGWRLLSVQSGSMAPTYAVGGLTVVAPANAGGMQVGDPVVFTRDGHLVVHRVLERIERPDGLFLRTRGDANPAADPVLVPARDVRGSVRLYLPRAGVLADAAFSVVGRALLLGVPALLLLVELRARRRTVSPGAGPRGPRVPAPSPG